MTQKLTDYLQQVDNYLIVLKDCSIFLSFDDYTINENLIINEQDKTIWVKSLLTKITFDEGLSFEILLDYSVNLFIDKYYKRIPKEGLILYYSKDSNFLETTLETENVKKQVLYIERLLGGREIYKDVPHLLMKLFAIYQGSNLDLVHLEVLLSNVLRDRADPTQPARLGHAFDPILTNIKNTIFKQNTFFSSLNFENVNKAISNGLIQSDENKEKSILEKVLLSEILD